MGVNDTDQASRGPAVIDWSAALKSVGGNRDILVALVPVFLAEYPRWLVQIHQAVAGRDAVTLRRAAHSLKGALSQFGAQPACAAAQHLENLGKDGAWDGVQAARAALERELERLRPALDTIPG